MQSKRRCGVETRRHRKNFSRQGASARKRTSEQCMDAWGQSYLSLLLSVRLRLCGSAHLREIRNETTQATPEPSHLVWEPSKFRDLVSGRRRGLGAAFLRGALRLAETPYTWAIRWRNRRYDRGAAAVHRVDVPVISVGNLTLGGTGKTPMVEWIAQWFADRAIPWPSSAADIGRPGDGGQNDEARELACQLPGVPHVQNPDRVAAARQAIRRVRLPGDRAGRCLPTSPHRPRPGYRAAGRPGAAGLRPRLSPRHAPRAAGRAAAEPTSSPCRGPTRWSPSRRESLRRHVAQLAPQAAWLEMRHAPRTLLSSAGGREPLDSLQGRPLAAFCGIGNPAGFRHTLAACGYKVAGFREFPDHHAYTPRLDGLAAWAKESGAAALLCTQKDLVKLPLDRAWRPAALGGGHRPGNPRGPRSFGIETGVVGKGLCG